MGSFDVLLNDDRTQLEAFVEEYRSALESTLDGLTEEQARSRLVPSATTLLGLLKHVTWMQRVWFEECIGGRPRLELGLVQSPEESFQLADGDTVTSVKAAHRQACATARAAVADLLFELHEAERTILIAVTHSLDLAARFPRRCELVEGRCTWPSVA